MTKNAIELRIRPVTKDLGEFSVARALPDSQRQSVGPFVFFDHMGPAHFPPGSGVNVRAHPHIGLATITYLFDGEILHRDSLGFVQPIRPGAVNWMTAGRGIVHSEKVSEKVKAEGQFLHGIQCWVALPTEFEEVAPRFEHYASEEIPSHQLDGAEVRVVVGSAFGMHSPVRSESDTLYVEVKLVAGASIEVPEADELGVYVVNGRVSVSGEPLGSRELAVLGPAGGLSLSAAEDSHVMLLGGRRLDGPRIVWWNFVSSRRDRIERAKRDWNEGNFDAVPGETDFIPLPS